MQRDNFAWEIITKSWTGLFLMLLLFLKMNINIMHTTLFSQLFVCSSTYVWVCENYINKLIGISTWNKIKDVTFTCKDGKPQQHTVILSNSRWIFKTFGGKTCCVKKQLKGKSLYILFYKKGKFYMGFVFLQKNIIRI